MKGLTRIWILGLMFLVLGGIGWLIRPISVHAGDCSPTVTVADSADSGPNTLRSAIDEVCTGGVIDFNFTVPTTITLTSDTLTLSRTVTIDGSTVPTLTVDGNDTLRVFVIQNSPSVTLTGFTIANGSSVPQSGGNINNIDGDLTLSNMQISGGFAAHGGGIFQQSGTLAISNSVLIDNLGGFSGGGLRVGGGSVTISHSRIVSNTSGNSGGGGLMIYPLLDPITVTIDHSTISNNASSGTGGGIRTWSPTAVPISLNIASSSIYNNDAVQGGGVRLNHGITQIANSTISSNTANVGNGGGIHIENVPTLVLVNSTIAYNDAANTAGGIGPLDGSITAVNTIVADNNAPNSPDCFGDLTSDGHNLIEDTSGCVIGGDATDDLYGVAPRLEPLGDYGGETLTHALMSDSPAIDAGFNSVCNADPINGLDQRDVPRAAHGANCDIGAFEYIAPVTTLAEISPTSGPEAGGTLLTLTGTNFGLAGATVLVGGQPCSNVVHVVPDTQLTCETPAGQGADQPVVVIAFGQASNVLLFDYEINIALNSGWNLVGFPLLDSQPITEALASIDGFYTTVYGYDAFDSADPWKMYDATVPSNYHALVNDLTEMEFGSGYWIYATMPVTWVLTSPDNRAPEQTLTMLPPPATYYGLVQGGGSFTPMPGQIVEAFVGGTLCGQGQTVAMPDSSTAYVVHVSADGDGSPNCGTTGQSVTFTVADEMMMPSALWNDTQANELLLMPGVPTAVSLTTVNLKGNDALSFQIVVAMLFILSIAALTASPRMKIRDNIRNQ